MVKDFNPELYIKLCEERERIGLPFDKRCYDLSQLCIAEPHLCDYLLSTMRAYIKTKAEKKEIERKFVVDIDNVPNIYKRVFDSVYQGYIKDFGENYQYRLRTVTSIDFDKKTMERKYFQTIKGAGDKIRDEYEIEITKSQFDELWKLCEDCAIHKYRYDVAVDKINKGHVDEYINEYIDALNEVYSKEKLSIIEVNFDSENECDAFVPPPWFGEEVTEKKEYGNFYMALHGLPKKTT